MNVRTTLILLVLLTALGGAYLLVQSVDGDGRTVAEGPATPLVTGRNFTTITIDQDGRTIKLRREGDRWWQVEPVRFVVANEAVEAIVNAALSLVPLDTVPVDGNGDASTSGPGLDPPAATVAFTSDAGTQTLHLGRGGVGNGATLRLDREAVVHRVTPTLHDLVVDARPATWRPAGLAAPDPAAVRRIRLDLGDTTTHLTRTPDGWRLGPDADARAEDAAAEALAGLPGTLEVRAYVSDDADVLARYGLAEPEVAAAWSTATGETRTLRVGRAADLADERVYATWSDTDAPSPVVLVLDRAAVEPLRADTDELRDPRLFAAEPGLVRGMRVERDGKVVLALDLQRDGRWAYAEPQPPYALDRELARQWVKALLANRDGGHLARSAQGRGSSCGHAATRRRTQRSGATAGATRPRRRGARARAG